MKFSPLTLAMFLSLSAVPAEAQDRHKEASEAGLVQARARSHSAAEGKIRTTSPDEEDGPSAHSEDFALQLDQKDLLRSYRQLFYFPVGQSGQMATYLNAHVRGLQPKSTRAFVEEALTNWASNPLSTPTKEVDEIKAISAKMLGCGPNEIALMSGPNSALHLLLVSFFQVQDQKNKILILENTAQSTVYALESQLRYHGLDPASHLIRVAAGGASSSSLAKKVSKIRHEMGSFLTAGAQAYVGQTDKAKRTIQKRNYNPCSITQAMEEWGDELALVFLEIVDPQTGTLLDLQNISKVAESHKIPLGLDISSAVGSVPLQLNQTSVDFAVWSMDRFLSGGPGAISGAFVHQCHECDWDAPRFVSKKSLAKSSPHLDGKVQQFMPSKGAAGWQVEESSSLSLAPLRASAQLLDEAGIQALHKKSLGLVTYLDYLLRRETDAQWTILSPEDRQSKSSIIAIELPNAARVHEELARDGFICELEGENTLRVAPAPLYNSFHDMWRFADSLKRCQNIR